MSALTLCVLAKPPVPGQAKTRLGQRLGPRRAAELARGFLADTLDGLAAMTDATTVLATTDPAQLRALATVPAAVPIWDQGGGDLGARLERVLARGCAGGAAAFALGADSPGLPPGHLVAARAALAGADVVLGPAADGGFYLLGVRRALPVGVLAGVRWSAADTGRQVEARLGAVGLRVALAPPWFDVDEPADLDRLSCLLAADPSRAPHTAARLARPISVVIPTLDEAARIEDAVAQAQGLAGVGEVIVVDGGSADDTVARATAARARVVVARRGRGPQLNAGAAAARGEVLLFLHADARLPTDAAAHVARALSGSGVVGGAFRLRTVAGGPSRLAPWLRLADVRSRYTRLPYGDQAQFARAVVFDRVGGFPDQPLFEDLELARRLRAVGRLVTVPAEVEVSGRRFLARPLYYTALVNVLPALYRLGVPAATLARTYGAVR